MTTQLATFAGGCFWCTADAYADKKGVIKLTSGYSGGKANDANYDKVASETTERKESIQIEFDDSVTSYEELLNIFWRSIDPTDDGGQFYDRGESYTTAIFYHTDNQKKIATKSKKENQKRFEKPIATKILPYKTFFPAEEEHQEYSKKHPLRYKMYKVGSGRESTLSKIWKN